MKILIQSPSVNVVAPPYIFCTSEAQLLLAIRGHAVHTIPQVCGRHASTYQLSVVDTFKSGPEVFQQRVIEFFLFESDKRFTGAYGETPRQLHAKTLRDCGRLLALSTCPITLPKSRGDYLLVTMREPHCIY
jgi:hypothetical protein